MEQHTCPHCHRLDGQVKAGVNESGSQRYLCKSCRRRYTPAPHLIGYTDAIRQRAVRMYVDGLNLRRIGRQLGVDHQTVANWVAAHANPLPEPPPLPAVGPRESLAVCELDELYTFIGHKKTGSTLSRKSTGRRAASSAGASPPTASLLPSRPS